MGRRRRPGERDIDGVVLLDKPSGMSSNHALQIVKRLYKASKAGHTGSLDKPASGMLPVCLGEATKVAGYLLGADKSYYALGTLGITTTTKDADGDIISTRPLDDLSEHRILQVLQRFTGRIEQVPPMYSAVRINGERLYRLAYRGETVARRPRAVTIHTLDLLAFDRHTFAIKVVCSKGTYIRTLVEDIGEALGCGAHVSVLRRLMVGALREEEMVTLAHIEALSRSDESERNLTSLLLPISRILTHLEAVVLDDQAVCGFCCGQAVAVQNAPRQGVVRVYDTNNVLLGIGTMKNPDEVAVKRLIKNQTPPS